ncbi:MAG: heme-binding protein [Sinobacterium sp.]|nr:heme-binding protein [Sinobacterium sp.]
MSQSTLFIQKSISAESALAWVNKAFSVAKGMDIAIGACVVDMQGQIKAQCIMDGAPLITAELISRKAKTGLLGVSSQELAIAVEADSAAVASMTSLSNLTLMGGGFPIIVEGEVVGGFAIGGASVEQDIACADVILAHFA